MSGHRGAGVDKSEDWDALEVELAGDGWPYRAPNRGHLGSLTARWSWDGSHLIEAAIPGFVLVAGCVLAGEEGVGGPVGQDSWTRSGLLLRRGSSAEVDDPSDSGEGGRMEALRLNAGRCGEWERKVAVERLQRLLRLERG